LRLSVRTTSVEEQKSADDTEIDPILETGSKDSGSLHDELDRTNEVAEELPTARVSDRRTKGVCDALSIASNSIQHRGRLQDKVLLLLLHLVETVLAATVADFRLRETSSGVGLGYSC
jgi:hypothetical protein